MSIERQGETYIADVRYCKVPTAAVFGDLEIATGKMMSFERPGDLLLLNSNSASDSYRGFSDCIAAVSPFHSAPSFLLTMLELEHMHSDQIFAMT